MYHYISHICHVIGSNIRITEAQSEVIKLSKMPGTVTHLNSNSKVQDAPQVQLPQPTYIIGAVLSGGTHQGKKRMYHWRCYYLF